MLTFSNFFVSEIFISNAVAYFVNTDPTVDTVAIMGNTSKDTKNKISDLMLLSFLH